MLNVYKIIDGRSYQLLGKWVNETDAKIYAKRLRGMGHKIRITAAPDVKRFGRGAGNVYWIWERRY